MFLISRGDLEDRLDSYFYQPEFLHLEKKIKNITSGKLRDYIINIASGATPKKEDAEKYYADRKNGIPFLRVQNVTPEGLNFENLKFINSQTHNGMLARSKVYEFDLLTKITGVGRMAVSSVAPKDFEGNINQHLVVIRTENEQTSRVLSAFLNTDIGEKLASRRATGGTRPALDYKALRSIPIVFKPEIVKVMDNAIARKKQKEIEAAAILASIDDYLLDELGITLPEAEENTIQNRMFKTTFSEVSGSRLDPFYYKPLFSKLTESIQNTKFNLTKIRSLSARIVNGFDCREFTETGVPYLRVSNIKANEFDLLDVKFISITKLKEYTRLTTGDLLVTRKGTYGNAVVVDKTLEDAVISSEIFKIELLPFINPYFLASWLNTNTVKLVFNRIRTGGIMGHITQEVLTDVPVPLPPMEKQIEIVNYIQAIRQQAKQLEQEGKDILAKAKTEVERIILGNRE